VICVAGKGSGQGGKKGSSGKHGGGHKVRQRGANASDRRKAEQEKQARIARDRAEAAKKKPEPPKKPEGDGK
jgi:hypothetical protein